MLSPARRLGRLVDFVSQPLDRPDRKLMRDCILGMALTASCCQTTWADALAEDSPGSTRRRINRFLNGDLDLPRLWDRLQTRNLRTLRTRQGRDVVVAVDYSAANHNAASMAAGAGMDGVVMCWQGSLGREDPGHPHVTIQGITDDGFHIPLLLQPWDRDETLEDGRTPRWPSDTRVYLDAIDRVRWAAGDETIWAFDRGYSARTYAPHFDRWDLAWVVRVSIANSMTLADLDGRRAQVGSLLDTAKVVARVQRTSCTARRKKLGPRTDEVRAIPVRLTMANAEKDPIGPVRTLISSTVVSNPRIRVVVLADRLLTDPEEILRYRAAYHRRWPAVETGLRQMKNRSTQFGLSYEDARGLNWPTIEKMALLVSIYQGFTSELGRVAQTAPASAAPVLDRVYTSASDPYDWRYRVTRGMTKYLQERIWAERERRRRSGQEPWKRVADCLFGELR